MAPRAVDEHFNRNERKSPEEMAEALKEAHDLHQLSKWEQSFMDNIYTALDQEQDLTTAQIVKLREIHDEYADI